MDRDTFTLALRDELRQYRVPFEPAELERFVEVWWWLAQDDPSPVRWALTFVSADRRPELRQRISEQRRQDAEVWLAGEDPRPLLNALRGRATERKLRLLAVALCRRAEHLLTDERSRRALAIAEWFADGAASAEDLAAAAAAATAACKAARAAWAERDAAWAQAMAARDSATARATRRGQARANWLASEAARRAAWQGPALAVPTLLQIVQYCGDAVVSAKAAVAEPLYGWPSGSRAGAAASAAELRHRADLVRDAFGTPFGRTVEPAWLAWQGGTVRKLARAIYDEGAFLDVPVLADALEDAGCRDREVLRHCREADEHARGCWVLDLLLGRG